MVRSDTLAVGGEGAADDRGVPQRDFQKEHWAMQQGKVVVRLLQTDVYHDRWSWEGFFDISDTTCNMFGSALCSHSAVSVRHLSQAAQRPDLQEKPFPTERQPLPGVWSCHG